MSVATEEQIAEAKMSIDAECSWTFHKAKKGRLYPIRKIKCIDTQQVFDTLKQAAEACDGCEDSIRHSIRNSTTYKGLTFYYLDEAPEDEHSYMIEAQNKFYHNTHSYKHHKKG